MLAAADASGSAPVAPTDSRVYGHSLHVVARSKLATTVALLTPPGKA